MYVASQLGKPQLKVDIEPRRLLITSEAYVVYTVRGYQPVVDVLEKKRRQEYYLFISAKSIAVPLELMRDSNNGRFTGIELWIRKDGVAKTSKYIVEE